MSGWTKLFASIVTSSVWCEPHATVRVWVAMLATADAEGAVEGSVPGFANLARVTISEMQAAVETLSAPDAHSRTKDHEGRRIEAVDGGWVILNYGLYRTRAQEKEGSKAPAMRNLRARRKEAGNKASKQVTPGNALPPKVTSYPEERGEKQRIRPSAVSTETAADVKAPLPWNREAAELWFQAYKGKADETYFGPLKALVKEYGWERVRPALVTYMAETRANYVSIGGKFASAFGTWEAKAKGNVEADAPGTKGGLLTMDGFDRQRQGS